MCLVGLVLVIILCLCLFLCLVNGRQYPCGVLFDCFGELKTPWCITINFSPMPDGIMNFNDERAFKWYHSHVVKEVGCVCCAYFRLRILNIVILILLIIGALRIVTTFGMDLKVMIMINFGK